MKRWGLVLSSFYLVVLLIFLVIGLGPSMFFGMLTTSPYVVGIWLAILVGGAAILLGTGVDTSQRRVIPQRHILVSAVTAAFFVASLVLAAVYAMVVGLHGDTFDTVPVFSSPWTVVGILAVVWGSWTVVFWRYGSAPDTMTSRMLSWLFRGSVLELLIAVPCHLVVRRRQDCSAPAVTGYGIASGLAIMLLSFGPGVILLYRQRFGRYRRD